MEEEIKITGIFVTNIVQPEKGAIVLVHCPGCKTSEFFVSPYAQKPDDGDFWKMEAMGCTTCHYMQPYGKEETAVKFWDKIASLNIAQWLTTKISL